MGTCNLTSGYSKPCREGVGGITEILVCPVSSITAFTESAGEITAITVDNNRFWKWELETDLSNATAVLTPSRENGTVHSVQTINVVLNDNRKETRNQLLLLAKNDLFVIVKQTDGDFEAYGVNYGCHLSSATRETGTAKGDRNGNTLVFNAMEKANPQKVSASIIASLQILTS
jgi:hypothetical protein